MRQHGLGTAGERGLWATGVSGGALNLLRHCAVARAVGADAVMATRSGADSYGALGVGNLPFVAWGRRRGDDVCIVPEIHSHLVDGVDGEVVVYAQSPLWLRRDFVHQRSNVRLWACSPLMTEHGRRGAARDRGSRLAPPSVADGLR